MSILDKINSPSDMKINPMHAKAFNMAGLPVNQAAIDPYSAGFRAT